MRIQQNCKHCNKELQGRTDKKYCNLHCKSAYQYQLAKEQPERFYNIVDNQLKLNRKILKEFNRGGKVTVRAALINELGFNADFFTHFWKNNKGEVYLFVYEYGFLKIKEQAKEKYVMVLWQDYMEKNIPKT